VFDCTPGIKRIDPVKSKFCSNNVLGFGRKSLCMQTMPIVYGVCVALKPLAVRVPAELEKEILEITKTEKIDKATVVRNLLETGITEWRKQTALDLLQKGKITFTKAAEIAKLSLWEFADLAKQHNIEWVRYTPEDVAKDFSKA
jgi:predicted HTH domain antitoxin